MKCLFNGVPLPALPAKILAYPHIWIYSITEPDGEYVPFTVYATEDAPKAFLGSDGTTEYWGYETTATGISATVYIDDSEWTVNNYTISAKTPNGPGWTNTDAYHLDGALWVAASDPIPVGTAPVIDPLSLWMGWKAGNWVARQRGRTKQPVSFLYNGVRLPKLPEWDSGVYPYAYIWQNASSGSYHLNCSSVPIIVYGADEYYLSSADSEPFIAYRFQNNIWEYWYQSTTSTSATNQIANALSKRSLIWANYDISREDDTVYLAGSDPVPVYE